MIPVVHHIDPSNDNYARLAEYIADAKNRGEKCLMTWTARCDAGQDYHLGISEVVATQAMKIRTEGNLTYHLSVSFHHEDEKKLTPEIYQAIEKKFATALGFSEHQRHCGVHTNTKNVHIHMAYNMLHPQTKARKEPYRDFFKLAKVARELEKEYGLTVDPGREALTDLELSKHDNTRAKKFEAHTGLKSFDTYVRERKEIIKEKLSSATTWQELHEGMAEHGLLIRLRGNGCVIEAIGSKKRGNLRIKASDLDRGFSKAALEKKLGKFEKSTGKYPMNERYGLEPAKKLRTEKERKLWRIYLRDREVRESRNEVARNFKNFSYHMQRFMEEGKGM